jgi:hypothetical protein
MIGKLFSKKKSNDGFYLQLDETASPAEATPATQPVVEQKIEVVVTETVTPEATPVATETKKTSVKKSKKTKEKAPTVAVAPQAVPQWEPPAWVAAMNKATSNDSQKEEASFAANNLLPLATPRRRPGPSMKGFLEMARQVKQ